MSKHNTPLISIIIPVYNVEKYIDKSIQSVLSQSHKNLEIIIVNDGSTDNGLNICKKYSQIDSRIKIIDKQNEGLSSARNAGIDIAKGEYIGFIDGDDWVEPEMYEKLLEAIINNNAEISICGVSRDYTDKSIVKKTQNSVMNNEKAIAKLLANSGIQDYAVNKLYKKRLWNEVRFPIGKYYEDILTTYKLFLKAKTIVSINQPYYHYIQREGSIARGTISPRQLEMLKSVETISQDSFISKHFKKILEIRKLKIKYTLLWYMLILGDEETIQKYDSIGKQFYKDIRKSTLKIIFSKYSSKSLQLCSILTLFPYAIFKKVYRDYKKL